MTDAEWLACQSPLTMVDALYGHPDRDKLRLLACRLCLTTGVRRLLERSGATSFITTAELFVAGDVDWRELSAEIQRAPQARVSGGSWRSHNPVRLPPTAQALRAVAALGADDSWNALAGVVRESVNLLGPEACEVIREVFAEPVTNQDGVILE